MFVIGDDCGGYLQPDLSLGGLATARWFPTKGEAQLIRDSLRARQKYHVYGDYAAPADVGPNDSGGEGPSVEREDRMLGRN